MPYNWWWRLMNDCEAPSNAQKESAMFEKILVTVDGSSASQKAIEKAVGIAKAFNSAVTIVSVIDSYAFSGVSVDFAYGQPEYQQAASAESKASIAAAQQQFDAAGIGAESVVVDGQAIFRGILETAASTHADLIVMGSHGRKGLEKLVLGSVASQVLSHAHVPVLIVR
jgi:nucleotide-binding universal stress UspA family protein